MRFIKQLKTKYSELSAGVKASIWFTVCNILQRGISVLTTPIFTRILTTEQYGVYSIYTSWYSIISIFTTLYLFASVYAKGLIEYEEDRDRFTASMVGLYSLSTLICFGIYLLFKQYLDAMFGLPSVCIYAMFAECLFYPAYSFWCTKQRVDYKYKAVIIFTLIMAIVSPLIGIVAIKSTVYKAEARILSFVFVQVVMGLFIYIRIIAKGKTFFDKKYWIYALRFNIPLIPHYLSLVVLQQSDRIMIGNLVGKSAASMYSVAYILAQMISLVTNAINYSYVPFAYRALKEEKYEILGKRIIQLLTMVSVILPVLMAFGPEIIRLIAAPAYSEAAWIIPAVAAASYYQYMYDLFTVVEYHFNKTGFIMIVSVISAVANVVLNYIFIPMFGYQAAAYTTLFCYAFTGLMHYIFSKHVFKKYTGLSGFVQGRKVLLISLLPLVSMGIMLLLYKIAVVRYIVLLLGLIVAIIFRKKLIAMVKKVF